MRFVTQCGGSLGGGWHVRMPHHGRPHRLVMRYCSAACGECACVALFVHCLTVVPAGSFSSFPSLAKPKARTTQQCRPLLNHFARRTHYAHTRHTTSTHHAHSKHVTSLETKRRNGPATNNTTILTTSFSPPLILYSPLISPSLWKYNRKHRQLQKKKDKYLTIFHSCVVYVLHACPPISK